MKHITRFACLAMIVGMATGCRNTVTSPSESFPQDFPNNVGDSWTFAEFDSLSKTSDTVYVSIVGQTELTSNRSATIWCYKYPTQTDTVFVTFSNDTAEFISGRTTKLIFPLRVGNQWPEDYVNDTNRVLENAPFSVPAASFPSAYQIVETWGGFNDYGKVIRWFVPQVGIISVSTRRLILGAYTNTTLQLIHYDIH